MSGSTNIAIDLFRDDFPTPDPMRRVIPPSFWEPEFVPVFVYGTLRVGEFNFPVIEPAVAEVIPGVMAVGEMGLPTPTAHLHPSFPAANFTRQGRVVGDLLITAHGEDAFWAADRMETGAGYERAFVEVRALVRDDPEDEGAYLWAVDALTWHWPDKPYDVFPEQDWCAYVRRVRAERAVQN